jgi:hypothetical protein
LHAFQKDQFVQLVENESNRVAASRSYQSLKCSVPEYQAVEVSAAVTAMMTDEHTVSYVLFHAIVE